MLQGNATTASFPVKCLIRGSASDVKLTAEYFEPCADSNPAESTAMKNSGRMCPSVIFVRQTSAPSM